MQAFQMSLDLLHGSHTALRSNISVPFTHKEFTFRAVIFYYLNLDRHGISHTVWPFSHMLDTIEFIRFHVMKFLTKNKLGRQYQYSTRHMCQKPKTSKIYGFSYSKKFVTDNKRRILFSLKIQTRCVNDCVCRYVFNRTVKDIVAIQTEIIVSFRK